MNQFSSLLHKILSDKSDWSNHVERETSDYRIGYPISSETSRQILSIENRSADGKKAADAENPGKMAGTAEEITRAGITFFSPDK